MNRERYGKAGMKGNMYVKGIRIDEGKHMQKKVNEGNEWREIYAKKYSCWKGENVQKGEMDMQKALMRIKYVQKKLYQRGIKCTRRKREGKIYAKKSLMKGKCKKKQ